MRVVLLSETYSKKMGYIQNGLPKALARKGVDVHLVTLDLPPYYGLQDFQQTYGAFNGVDAAHPSIERVDGYTVHYLPPSKFLGYMRMDGLFAKLKSLQPDIVQSFTTISWIPLDAAWARPLLGYKLFTGNHTAASTFPLARLGDSWRNPAYVRCMLTRAVPGRLVSLGAEKCYAVTSDCGEIASRFFGVERDKVVIMHLGVDTDIFFPVRTAEHMAERRRVRSELGLDDSEILCIYTGKLSQQKNAAILAQAVSRLRARGEPFTALFVGEGTQREEIRSTPHCIVKPFMPFQELAPFYRAADVAVWPTNESTSMLDAAACGLPLIVSDGIVYREHVEGNGLVCKMNDLEDLAEQLLKLRGPDERLRLGSEGAKKMARDFSWDLVAARRLSDYEKALKENEI